MSKHKTAIVISILLVFLLYLLFRNQAGFWYATLTVSLSFLAVTAYGVANIKANYFVTSINKGDADGIAITFDDGPDPQITPRILETLKKENIQATFFIIGKKAEQFPEIVGEIYEQGHQIGNHSYSHSNFLPFQTKSALKDDIAACSLILENIIHQKVKMFRPPFGVTNPKYKPVLDELSLQSIGWTVRTLDTTINNKADLLKRSTRKLKPGAIVLFHDTSVITAEILVDFIEFCKNNKLQILPLSKIIRTS